ncbi:putative membrane protein [Bacillus phage SP-15]|uniref:Putative membrane protein n=1 Tax=Bacillus phage SP-15 TaxID=1792032 RepID=A0A127AWH6_9CAUD|nr:hypothetical protein SP15_244 [Bacillus phage SP-15]AMM45049.1 putative membrane protein [Bacillus phage SP-15]
MTNTRTSRHQRKGIFGKLFLLATLIVILFYGVNYVAFSKTSKADAPVDLGRKVEVVLQNGNIMTTREAYIVKEDGKVYYRSKTNQIDITGCEIKYLE